MALYLRDPDGHLIEVGQYTETALDWFNNRSLFGKRQTGKGSELPRLSV